jgi:elongator complex protein 3
MKPPLKNEIRKPSKTLAGVTPIAVMCKPKKCKHGTCLYCPSLDVPQSYTPKSPPVLRGERTKYDPYKQVKSRLDAYSLMNHPTDKIELIIMGGNFLEYPIEYQYNFVKGCYDALNGKKAENLDKAKKINEKAKHRCIALCIESRPDTCTEQNIKRALEFGCTRIELGVQCLDDDIYLFVNRGHTVKEVIETTKRLKNYGFKIGYHIMLGLPKSNPKKDLEMFKTLFKDIRFKPDQLKIYPCQVIKGAELVELYKKGLYHPYSKEDIEELLIKIMKIIPRYCRVMRVMREIPPEYLVAGTIRIDLRRDLELELKRGESKNKIKEIRFREIGFILRDKKIGEKINDKLKMKITKYKASDGDEYFLEFVNNDDVLFGLCRLRIFSNRKTNNKEAFIRELHVYGKSIDIGKKPSKKDSISQHKGLGKKFMKEAENISKHEKVNELNIISGVGVREYYKKIGYKLDKNKVYMVKKIK